MERKIPLPRAGAFKVDITPPSPGRSVERPLYIRGILVDHPVHGSGAFVVWDQIGIFQHDAGRIRQAISQSTGIPTSSILLTATHTESGYWELYEPNPRFVEFVSKRAAEAAGDAFTRREPVRVGWSSLQAPGINRNRTVYLKDGKAYTERWAQPSSWHIPREEILRRGPTDEEIRVLVFERLDGSRLATAAIFSCHNTAGIKDSRIHDDFFGVAMEIVERVEGCITLCAPGSEGDQDPTVLVRLGGERDVAYAEKLGKRLAGYLLTALADVSMQENFSFGTGSRMVKVGVRDDWRPDVWRTPEVSQWSKRGEVEAEVTALAIGDFALVGIPAEIFTDPARKICEHSPFAITAVVALTNGLLMYVAEEEAFFDKSLIYGVHQNPADMAVAGTDSLLVEAGLGALREAASSSPS
jgi:hypothetical protein